MHCCKPVRIVNTTLEVTSQVQCSAPTDQDYILSWSLILILRCNIVMRLYEHYRYHTSDEEDDVLYQR